MTAHLDTPYQMDLHPESKEESRLASLRRMERIRKCAISEAMNHGGMINSCWLKLVCPEYNDLDRKAKGSIFKDNRFEDTGMMYHSTIESDKCRKVTLWRVNVI